MIFFTSKISQNRNFYEKIGLSVVYYLFFLHNICISIQNPKITMRHLVACIVYMLLFFVAFLVSSFMVVDFIESSDPLVNQGVRWIDDNKLLSALIVSEVAPLVSKKVSGFAHGGWYLLKRVFQFVKYKSGKP